MKREFTLKSIAIFAIVNIIAALLLLTTGCSDTTGFSNPISTVEPAQIQPQYSPPTTPTIPTIIPPTYEPPVNPLQPIQTGDPLIDNIFSFLHIQDQSMETLGQIVSNEIGYIIMAEVLKNPKDMMKALQNAVQRILTEVDNEKAANTLASLMQVISNPNVWLITLNAMDAMNTAEQLAKIPRTHPKKQDELIEEVFDDLIQGATIPPSVGG